MRVIDPGFRLPGNGLVSRLDHLANAEQFREKARLAGLQRILDPQRGADDKRRDAQPGGADWSAGQGQHGVNADRPEHRALAGHV